jgi:ribonucleoside-diphosphate reductase alpha chain
MRIKKRDGSFEKLSFDKVIYRLRKLCKDKALGVLKGIDSDIVAQRVISGIYDGVTSCELDEEAARIAVGMTENVEYQQLASRIIISNLHKSTNECFSEVMEALYNNVDKAGEAMPVISDEVMAIVREHKNTLNFSIDYSRDYLFDYFGYKTLERSYLMKIKNHDTDKMVVVERPQHMYMRVAVGIHREDIDAAIKTYNLISQHYYTHASPTLFNSASRLSNLSSCFLIGTDDNIEGIFKTVTDCARISKVAGGIGLHVSNIRARGSLIRGTNGPSDGIVPMLKVYNETAKYINQGSRRKGSFAIYIEPFHADIMEFLELKKNQGHDDVRARDLFYAIWMPDLFMKQVESDGDWYLMCPDECPGLPDAYGEAFEALYWRYVEEKRYKRVVKAQDVWKKILEAQIESGVPYIAYKDAVNKKCNQKNLGTIKSSNLCVAPETMILTSKGYYPISQLENVETDVWNGESFSTTTIRKTGVDQELLKVMLSNGSELECTPYHKFYIAQGKRPSAYPRLAQIDAQNLQKGMILIKSNFPIIKEGSSDFPYPYEHGLFCADGTLEHNSDNAKPLPRVTLYGEKIKLAPYLTTRIEPCAMDRNGRVHCRLPKDLFDKYTVPLNCNLDIKLRWFEGLMDGDGCIIKSDGLTGMQLSSIHLDFLRNVKYMLQTMGCDPKITLGNEAGWRTMPDGKGGSAEFYCHQIYRLLITSHDTSILYDLGFRPKRLVINGVYPRKNTKRWIKVEDVIRTGRISDTYCFKEKKRGMGIFNGILTGQCAEISLYSDHENYAICNLCSIALPKYVKYDQKGKPYFDFDHLCEIAEYVIGPMNKVIDNNYYPTEECRKTNMAHRPLGIGVQGLADVYFKMGFPFESPEAKALNREIFETIYYGCMKGSIAAAKRDGPYESFRGSPFSEGKLQFDLAAEFDGIKLEETLSGRWDWDALRKELVEHGARNSMLMALMPTASTAQIMNNTEAFEPIDSCIFKRRVLSGEYMVINKYLVAELLELGLWSKEMKDRIIANEGSIQGIPEIPQRIKDIYKTVWEISMKSVIEQAADRGVFVDQMQSMNLFMANPNYKKLTSMHFYAWRHHLKTGMYYLRSKASASAGKFSIDANLEKQMREAQLSEEEMAKLVCSLENKEACEMCSS